MNSHPSAYHGEGKLDSPFLDSEQWERIYLAEESVPFSEAENALPAEENVGELRYEEEAKEEDDAIENDETDNDEPNRIQVNDADIDELFIAELFEGEASNLKEKFTWYQTFLRIIEKENITIDGSWGNQSKQALRRFQKKYGLRVGRISPQTTLAVIQLGLEWTYLQKLNNNLGTKSQNLVKAIKKFQTDYKLGVDGRVGPQTRATIVRIFNGKLPRQVLYSGSHCEVTTLLGTRKKVGDTSAEPYRWICAIHFAKKIPNTNKKGDFIGTGFLVSPEHVITAAHNLHSLVNGANNTVKAVTASKVTVYSGASFTGSRTSGKNLFIPGEWKKSVASRKYDTRYNYALIKLKNKIEIVTDVGDEIFRYWKVAIDPKLPKRFKGSGAGYPIDDVFLSGYPCDKKKKYYHQWESEVRGSFIQNGLAFFNSDAATGNSGGPIWEKRTIGNQTQRVVVGIFSGPQGEAWWEQPLYMPIEAANTLRGVWLSPTILQRIAGWDPDNLKVVDNTLEYIGGRA